MVKIRILLCLQLFLFVPIDSAHYFDDVYETVLDHHNSSDIRTFDLQFSYSADYFREAGPVLIYVVGGALDYPEFLGITKGLIDYFATYYNGYIFILEHRYFGESKPVNHFPHMTLEALKYLTLDNILGDIAAFSHYVTTSPRFGITDANKIILLGYGYGGALATWTRQRYNHLFDGLWVTSPFTIVKHDFENFGSILAELYPWFSKCAEIYYNNYEELKKELEANKAQELPFADKLCMLDFYDTSKLNMKYVGKRVLDPIIYGFDKIQDLPDVTIEQRVKGLCDRVTEAQKTDKFAAINIMLEEKACLDLNYTRWTDYLAYEEWFPPLFENGLDVQYFDDVSWFWLQCTEFGWFRTSAIFNFDFFYFMCKDAFYDEKITPKLVDINNLVDRLNRTRNEFGSGFTEKDAQSTNIFVLPKKDPFKTITPAIDPALQYGILDMPVEFGGDFSAFGLPEDQWLGYTIEKGDQLGLEVITARENPVEPVDFDSEENPAGDTIYVGHIETNTSTSQNPKFGKIRVRFFKSREVGSGKPDKPVFVVLGGPFYLFDYFLKTGPILEMAKDHDAELYHLEHRFFGKSFPISNTIPSTSVEMLENGLSIRQVMEDIKQFIKQIVAKTSPVILFSYGYMGLIATAVQREMPDRVLGVWASSAILKADYDWNEQYFNSIGTLLGDYVENGLSTFQRVFQAFAQYAIPHNRQILNQSIPCKYEITETDLFVNLMEMTWWLEDVLAPDLPRQSSTKDEIKNRISNKFSGSTKPDENLREYFGMFNKRSCLRSTILDNFNNIANAEDIGNGAYARFSRPWLYMQCREEFLNYMIFFYEFQFKGGQEKLTSLKMTGKLCWALFKKGFNNDDLVRAQYGIKEDDADYYRVFTYGSHDLYATLKHDELTRGLIRKLNEDKKKTHMIECHNCGYAEDIFGHPSAHTTIGQVKQLISAWLASANEIH